MTIDSSAGSCPGPCSWPEPLCKLRDGVMTTRDLCSDLVLCAAPTGQGSAAPGSHSTRHTRVGGRDGVVPSRPRRRLLLHRPAHRDSGGQAAPQTPGLLRRPHPTRTRPSPLSVRKEETPMPLVLLPLSRRQHSASLSQEKKSPLPKASNAFLPSLPSFSRSPLFL